MSELLEYVREKATWAVGLGVKPAWKLACVKPGPQPANKNLLSETIMCSEIDRYLERHLGKCKFHRHPSPNIDEHVMSVEFSGTPFQSPRVYQSALHLYTPDYHESLDRFHRVHVVPFVESVYESL